MIHGKSCGIDNINNDDWMLYKSVFEKSKYKNRIIDIRGNHEARGVSQYNNLYKNYTYSNSSKLITKYTYYLNNNTKYNFIGIDMNTMPGTRKVVNYFNFFGSMASSNLNDLSKMLSKSKAYIVIYLVIILLFIHISHLIQFIHLKLMII